MALQEDLIPFFADFGDDGLLAGRPVRGIFDAQGAFPGIGGMVVATGVPSFLLPAAAVQVGDVDAALVIPQGSYTVRRVEPGDPGLTVLQLEA